MRRFNIINGKMVEDDLGEWVRFEHHILENETASRDSQSSVPSEEVKLRKLLWLHHGCQKHRLYGDDGEMQCLQCGLDFKRETANALERGIAG